VRKLVVLAVLVVVALAGYVLLVRPPERRACRRVAELCGFDPTGVETDRCTEMLRSLKQANMAAAASASKCVSDARSCAEAAGCASEAALRIGAGLVKDFVGGMHQANK
jgi:hypothetical protein